MNGSISLNADDLVVGPEFERWARGSDDDLADFNASDFERTIDVMLPPERPFIPGRYVFEKRLASERVATRPLVRRRKSSTSSSSSAGSSASSTASAVPASSATKRARRRSQSKQCRRTRKKIPVSESSANIRISETSPCESTRGRKMKDECQSSPAAKSPSGSRRKFRQVTAVDLDPGAGSRFLPGTRYLNVGNDVSYLADFIDTPKVGKFVMAFLDGWHDAADERPVVITKTAMETLQYCAMERLYSMLCSFIVVYHSFKETGYVRESFLPDFVEMTDPLYDDSQAANFCPERQRAKSPDLLRPKRRKSVYREPRGQIMHAKSKAPTYFVRREKPAKKNDRAVRVDRSCVLVNQQNVLSPSFLRALRDRLTTYFLANTHIDANFRFARKFGNEVNQVFVFYIEQALQTACVIASYRSRRLAGKLRLSDNDILYAFQRMPQPYVRSANVSYQIDPDNPDAIKPLNVKTNLPPRPSSRRRLAESDDVEVLDQSIRVSRTARGR